MTTTEQTTESNGSPKPTRRTRADAGKPRGPRPAALATAVLVEEAVAKAVCGMSDDEIRVVAANARLTMSTVEREVAAREARLADTKRIVRGDP